jgi:hypothetical protein
MVAQEVEGELVDHPLVLIHQVRTGLLIVRRAPLYEQRFASGDFRPGDCS